MKSALSASRYAKLGLVSKSESHARIPRLLLMSGSSVRCRSMRGEVLRKSVRSQLCDVLNVMRINSVKIAIRSEYVASGVCVIDKYILT